ncbi:MAG: hypothetical protein AAB535_00595 [Patescibacteria group bacterium]
MAATPEIPRQEVPQIQERTDEFIVPETLQQSTGVKVVQKNFTAQVKSDRGQPLIQTPPTQVISVTPPAPQITLTSWAKGSITSSLSWLGTFWIRVIKKAMHFGWKVEERQDVTN